MRTRTYKIILAGGVDWADKFFDLLLNMGFEVPGIITTPDKKMGRGLKSFPPYLKTYAQKRNIKVWQPKKINDPDFLKEVELISPDLVLVIAYGKLLPKEFLNIPRLGCLNFHPSFLPQLRGPSPIQSAILKGLEKSGITIFKLDEGMDSGPIVVQEEITLSPRETAVTLTEKAVSLGIKLLNSSLLPFLEGKIVPKPQKGKATYCQVITKKDGEIQWHNELAAGIDRKVRALEGWFKVFTNLNIRGISKRVDIIKTRGVVSKDGIILAPGEYSSFQKNSNVYLAIGTKENILLVESLKVEGKNELSAKNFLLGYKEGKFE